MLKNLICFFQEMNENFQLLNNIDLTNYSQKLIEKAYIITFYNKNKIEGLSAFYVNDNINHIGYISFIGKTTKSRIKGKQLLSTTLEIMKSFEMKSCKLEVQKNNSNAIFFYENNGFLNEFEKNDSIFMIKTW
jgi:predicted GNAT family N-acyltransferase